MIRMTLACAGFAVAILAFASLAAAQPAQIDPQPAQIDPQPAQIDPQPAQIDPPPKPPAKTGPLHPDLMPPVALKAADKLIDVDVGHAAPFVADINGDGKLHLLVGQFGDGKLRLYPNEGDAKSPRFGEFTWFKAGKEIGKVPSG